MVRTQKFRENVLKITNLETGDEDYALDVASAAHVMDCSQIAIYKFFERGKQKRIKNFALELVSLDEFISIKRRAKTNG